MFAGICASEMMKPSAVVVNTWSPASLSPPSVLDLSDARVRADAAISGDYANARSVKAISGKCYFSVYVTCSASGANVGAGVGDATWVSSNAAHYAGGSSGSGSLTVGLWGVNRSVYFNGSVIATAAGGFTSNAGYVQVAVDTATRKVWLRVGGAAWVGGGDPATGTLPTATLSGSGALYVVATVSKLMGTS